MPDYRELLTAFRDETELSEAGAARLRRRLAEPEPRPRRGLVLALGGVAIAALVGLALRPVPVGGPLQSGALTHEVSLVVDGAGQVSGDSRSMKLRLDLGQLDVEVEPERGVALSVSTDEAEIAVVGTGFRVARDALGTSVQVRHGQVRVACAAATPTLISAGEERACLPRSAAGRLGRIRALQDANTPADALLAETADALALPDATGDVAAELGSARLDALLNLNRRDDALALAEQLATAGGPRTLDHHRVAARLRLSAPSGPDCAGALPHLRALADADRLDEDAPWLSTCESEYSP